MKNVLTKKKNRKEIKLLKKTKEEKTHHDDFGRRKNS